MRQAFPALLVVGSLLLANCASDRSRTPLPQEPEPDPTASIGILVDGPVSVIQGLSEETGVTLIRTGGYTGPVALTALNLPAGVTASFRPDIIPQGSSTSVLILSAAADAPVTNAQYAVTASGSGVSDAIGTGSVQVRVPPPPPFGVKVDPTAVSVEAGSSATASVVFLRNSPFLDGEVRLWASNLPPGVKATLEPSWFWFNMGGRPTSARSTLTLSVAEGVASGDYPLTIGASWSGRGQSAALTLTVP